MFYRDKWVTISGSQRRAVRKGVSSIRGVLEPTQLHLQYMELMRMERQQER